MRTASFLWRFTRPDVAWLGVAAVSIPLFAAATVGLVAMTGPIYQEVLLISSIAPASSPGRTPIAPPAPSFPRWLNLKATTDRGYLMLERSLGINDRTVVYFAPLLVLGLFAFRGMADFISGYAFQRVGLGLTARIREELYRALLAQSARVHGRYNSGELVSRVISDVGQIQTTVSTRLFDLVQQAVVVLVLLVLLISTNARLALVCLVGAPLAVVPIVRFGKGMRRASERGQADMAALTTVMAEGLRGHRIVKAYSMEPFEMRRFEAANRRYLSANLRGQLLANLSSPVVEQMLAIGAVALLIYAGLHVRSGALNAVILVQFIANLVLLYDPIRRINRAQLALHQAMASATRVQDILAIPDDVVSRPGARALTEFTDRIVFDHVEFAYAQTPVLRDVSLEIRRGETVAFVGPSGAGKTTLVNLLPRFFDPDRGRVTLDATDLRDVTLVSLRGLIGIVTQEIVLFDDTVRNNIAYGRADISFARVQAAAEAAHADAFIRLLPGSYDWVIGESGRQLSGGQRQRLAIARALLKDAPILILDEATSQLDSESELLVQDALRNLKRGRTTLVIAHRLATVVEADRIVVVDAGQIVETGRHADLLATSAAYRRLFEGQFVLRQPVA